MPVPWGVMTIHRVRDVPLGEQSRGALVQALPLLTWGLLMLAGIVLFDGGGLLVPAVLTGLSVVSALLRSRLIKRTDEPVASCST